MGVTRLGRGGKRKGGRDCGVSAKRHEKSWVRQPATKLGVGRGGPDKGGGGYGGGVGWGERELSEKYRESDSGKSRNCRWQRRKALYCRKLDTATERLYYFIPLSRATL